MTETTNLIFAGVGGQGVLLIAELTALAAVRAGYDVKQTEVHGVSQRGGSVEGHVRFGLEVHSPLVQRGQADVVVGLEKLEGLRYASYLRSGGQVADGRWPAAAEGQPFPTSQRRSAGDWSRGSPDHATAATGQPTGSSRRQRSRSTATRMAEAIPAA